MDGCTIGWIKTKEGYILFKNRDTRKKYLKDNSFQKTKNLVRIGYKSGRNGCWIGVNNYGIGFTSAKGPYRKVSEGYSTWIKFNEIGEKVLKKARNLEEALNLFIDSYKKQKVGESANVLLCDKNRAYLLELCLGNVKIKKYSRSVFKTNHFELMKNFNKNFKSLNASLKRLKKFKNLFKDYKPKTAEGLIPLLTYHSRDSEENICRHGRIMTVGSSIFEFSATKIVVLYSINEAPCKGKFSKKEIKLK